MANKYIVYDFDDTIYDGDSSADFYKFAIKRYPFILLFLPIHIFSFAMIKFKLIDDTRMKELFFSFLKYVKDVDFLISDFWKMNEHKIKSFYDRSDKDHSRDIIISASPEFLIEHILMMKGITVVKLIGSKIDKITGKFSSKNCYGKEKVIRLYEYEKDCIIEEFYTDNLHADKPMADIAEKVYHVKKDEIIELI